MNKEMQNILARLEKLESEVFGNVKPQKKLTKLSTPSYGGAKGGCLLLVSRGFFNKKRTAPEVKEELEKNEYHYLLAVVQTTLNRLATKSGSLVAMKDSNSKTYVKRK